MCEKIDQFVLNATKYVKMCDICNDLTLNKKLNVVQIIYNDKNYIKSICQKCFDKICKVK